MKLVLRSNDWLDDQTKNKSIEKLNAVTEYIGYPDWILSNSELDKFYNLVNIILVEYFLI